MGSYVPTSPEERESMLAAVGMKSLDDLYASVPEEVYRKEKQQEKRLFILMVTLCVLMVGGLCAWLIWLFKPDFQAIGKNLLSDFSKLQNLTFYLPMILALPLLAWFNHWLRKKFRLPG